ncbi:MAG: hypothetical protein KatS3mg088_623 [Patescibacteria group bacterium]|nr:MAG: hypothetical protein KatS3mg088_623 [Patescibacteria group bacterium]
MVLCPKMKKVYFLFLLLLFAFTALYFGNKVFFKSPVVGNDDKEDKILGLKEESPALKVKIDSSEYFFDYFLADPEKLFLFPNFSSGDKGEYLKEKFSCKNVINGGFYDENFRPIGLFISEYGEISPWRKNQLFNGIFSVNIFDTPRITREKPRDSLRIAVQSGPLLFENGSVVNIRSNYNHERRVVVAVTGENKVVFLVFWGINNLLEGPTLEELPALIEKITNDFNLGIADAINLDGGTASLFYSDKTTLSEISKVGSIFCTR